MSRFIGLGRYYLGGGQLRAHELLGKIKGWVFTALELRANAQGSLQREIYQVDPNDPAKEIAVAPNHWARQLFDNPNPTLEWINRVEVFRGIQRWRDGWGTACIWTPTNGHDRPVQIYVLPTSLVTPRSDSTAPNGGGLVDYYELQTDRGISRLPKDEVAWLPRLGVVSDLYRSQIEGVALIRMGMDAIVAGEAMQEFVRNLFEFGGTPPTMIEIPGDGDSGDPEEAEAVLMRFLEKYQGRNGSVPFGIMPPGWKLVKIDLVQGIEQMLANAKELKAEFLEVCGISLTRIDQSAASYATAQVTEYQFRTDAIEPEADLIDAVLTQHLNKWVKPGEPRLVLRHTPFVYKDDEQIRLQEAHELQTGVKTINQARIERGWEPVEGGDTPHVMGTWVPLAMLGTPGAIPTQNLNVTATSDMKTILAQIFGEDAPAEMAVKHHANEATDPGAQITQSAGVGSGPFQ